MRDGYRPIDCGLHSQYELWIMQGTPLRLRWRDETGCEQRQQGWARDLLTRAGAEFLLIETSAGERFEIRLDRLLEVAPA